jgi:hypothetical protein
MGEFSLLGIRDVAIIDINSSGGPPHPIRSKDYARLFSEKFDRVRYYMPEVSISSKYHG